MGIILLVVQKYSENESWKDSDVPVVVGIVSDMEEKDASRVEEVYEKG